ncbi:MAG: pyrroloquinoline quinone biosynthesis peptide chaperone PqqD [Candidatus Rokuibacteriota bacterium]|nr:MAG: pyrroloquinoline quinone biosynthesis peptide chaperone PqqD [Candidatus Rokubacteria bacterium]
MHRRAHPQDRDPVASARLPLGGVRRTRLGARRRARVSEPRTLTADSRPVVAAKARLRWDARSSRHLLLYPERGLILNPTAADVIQLCTGAHTVADIVDRLAAKYAPQPRETVEREVLTFLVNMADRGLIREHDD